MGYCIKIKGNIMVYCPHYTEINQCIFNFRLRLTPKLKFAK